MAESEPRERFAVNPRRRFATAAAGMGRFAVKYGETPACSPVLQLRATLQS